MKSVRKYFILCIGFAALCTSINLLAELSAAKINEMIGKLHQQRAILMSTLSSPNMSERDLNQAPFDIKMIKDDLQKMRNAINILIENQQAVLENSKK